MNELHCKLQKVKVQFECIFPVVWREIASIIHQVSCIGIEITAATQINWFLHCVLAHNTLTGDKGLNMSSPPIREIETLNAQHQVTRESNNSKLRQNEDLSHGENDLNRQVPNRKTSYKTLRIFTKFAYYFRPDWTKSALCYIILK